jgi:hypothetical protein
MVRLFLDSPPKKAQNKRLIINLTDFANVAEY